MVVLRDHHEGSKQIKIVKLATLKDAFSGERFLASGSVCVCWSSTGSPIVDPQQWLFLNPGGPHYGEQ